MIGSRRLTTTLTRALEVKAEQAKDARPGPVDARIFAASARLSATSGTDEVTAGENDGHDGAGDPAPSFVAAAGSGGRRRVLLAAAALIVVTMVGVGAIAVRSAPDRQPVDIVVGDPPDGWLMPTWVPGAMALWGVDRSMSSAQPSAPGDGTIPQLFGDPDAGRAILVTSFRYEVRPDMAEQVTVRGQQGQAGPGWDVEERDMGEAIAWEERGVTMTALYKGMTRDEAVAALESLQWRSDDPADGFAAPDRGSLPLRGEVDTRQAVEHSLTLHYSEELTDASGDLPGLSIHTSTSTTVSAEYLERWYDRGSDAGGGGRPVRTYREDRHQLTVAWPDGRWVDISPYEATRAQLPSRAELERIADSMAVADETDLVALRDQASANIAALPVVAAAETGIGRVEVHGSSRVPRLCLRRPGSSAVDCATALSYGPSVDGNAIATAEWTVDGTWYVVLASQGELPQIVGGRDRTRSPDAGELPSEVTPAGDWTVHLVRPAPDIVSVCTSGEGWNSCVQHRGD